MDVRANGRKSRQQGRKERDRKKSKEKVGVGKNQNKHVEGNAHRK
jgi:hypothetical protein